MSAGHGLPKPDKYAVHRYWTDQIKTHGRYMAFVFGAQPFGFVDEIGVFRGDDEWAHRAHAGKPIRDIKDAMVRVAAASDPPPSPPGHHGHRGEARERRRRRGREEAIAAGLADAREACAALPDVALRDVQGHPAAQRAAPRCPGAPGRVVAGAGFRSAHRLAVALVGSGPSPRRPRERRFAESLAVHLMRNEYRAGCFSISNATGSLIRCGSTSRDSPAARIPPALPCMKSSGPARKRGSPLRRCQHQQDGGYVIEVPAGMTRQVWLTFHPQAVDAGMLPGRIVVASAQHGEQRFPVEMRVYPFEFPARPTLHFGGWDYSNGSGNWGSPSTTWRSLSPTAANIMWIRRGPPAR